MKNNIKGIYYIQKNKIFHKFTLNPLKRCFKMILSHDIQSKIQDNSYKNMKLVDKYFLKNISFLSFL